MVGVGAQPLHQHLVRAVVRLFVFAVAVGGRSDDRLRRPRCAPIRLVLACLGCRRLLLLLAAAFVLLCLGLGGAACLLRRRVVLRRRRLLPGACVRGRRPRPVRLRPCVPPRRAVRRGGLPSRPPSPLPCAGARPPSPVPCGGVRRPWPAPRRRGVPPGRRWRLLLPGVSVRGRRSRLARLRLCVLPRRGARPAGLPRPLLSPRSLRRRSSSFAWASAARRASAAAAVLRGRGCFLAFAFAGVDLGLCRCGFAFFLGAALGQAGFLGRRFLLVPCGGVGRPSPGPRRRVGLRRSWRLRSRASISACAAAALRSSSARRSGFRRASSAAAFSSSLRLRPSSFAWASAAAARLLVGPALIGRLPLGRSDARPRGASPPLRQRSSRAAVSPTLSGDRRRLERTAPLERRVLASPPRP